MEKSVKTEIVLATLSKTCDNTSGGAMMQRIA
jgi:hypothetical protein